MCIHFNARRDENLQQSFVPIDFLHFIFDSAYNRIRGGSSLIIYMRSYGGFLAASF
jgi:hypothetical protein